MLTKANLCFIIVLFSLSYHVESDVLAKEHEEELRQQKILELVMKEAVATANNAGGQCGVTGVQDDGEWQPSGSITRCGVQMMINCSLSYSQVTCPQECPLVAPSARFPCLIWCVKAKQCSLRSPGRALPNFDNRICDICEISGCALCRSKDVCLQCYTGFKLVENNGTRHCEFIFDSSGITGFVLNILICLVALVLVLAIVYCLCGSRSPNAETNLVSIMEGRKHRHMCKVANWDRKNSRNPRALYHLLANVHYRNILGVGFGLFYNSILFITVVFCIGCACLYFWSGSDLGLVIPLEDTSWGAIAQQALKAKSEEPAVLSSPMQYCWIERPEELREQLRIFADQRFKASIAMYVLVFVASLAFGKFQIWFAVWFDANHVEMADFAVEVTGLPPTATHEADLVDWFQTMFDDLPPDTYVQGVSIAYDYSDISEEVYHKLNRQLKYAEGRLGTGVKDTYPTDAEQLADKLEYDRDEVRKWFSEGKLRSTGKAFVVFSHASAKDAALKKCKDKPECLRHPDSKDKQLLVSLTHCEPCNVFWDNLHYSQDDIRHNRRKAVLKLVLIFLVTYACIIYPYNRFVVVPFTRAGKTSAGPFQVIAGLLLGIVNQQLGGQIWQNAHHIGYHGKDSVEPFIFMMNVFFSLVNTGICLLLNGVSAASTETGSLSMLTEAEFTDGLGIESAMARNTYLMLVPGGLYMNHIMGLLLGNMVPFIQHSLVQKIIYCWRSLPDFLLKLLKLLLPWSPSDIDVYERLNAENAFKAGEIGLAYDYASLIVNSTIAFATLLCISQFVLSIFQNIVLWSLFYYFFSRFMHFRVNSMSRFTTNHLDSMVLIFWFIPLSTLAVVCYIWGLRSAAYMTDSSDFLKIVVLVLVFIGSAVLWIFLYASLINPFNREEAKEVNNLSVDQVFEDKLYSWYNCNPVYTLKCAYYLDDIYKDKEQRRGTAAHPVSSTVNGDLLTFYKSGKEYLFFPKDEQQLINATLYDAIEFETYFEIILEQLHWLANLLLCKQEEARSTGYSRVGSHINNLLM